MVFVGGPRQVGKTTLCQAIGQGLSPKYQYLNWDNDEDRAIILNKTWLKASPLVIFDELHKYPHWKQWIKGVYDSRLTHQIFAVTGSARLDLYKKDGDSLLGRYHYWRIHPLSLDELPRDMTKEEGLKRLLNLGGFPEPFLQGDEREAKRWRRERFQRILKEDIRDLHPIKDIQALQLMVDALRHRAGQLIAVANLAQDIQISPTTAKVWLQLIENMYLAFAIYPLTKNINRAIQKPAKVYFYDNADLKNDTGLKLENLVATHLLKRLHFLEDYYGYDCALHYIRDKDGREVDFVTLIDGEVIDLIEVKLSDNTISSALKYFKKQLNPKKTIQIVGNLNKSFEQDGIIVINPIEYFINPPWDIA